MPERRSRYPSPSHRLDDRRDGLAVQPDQRAATPSRLRETRLTPTLSDVARLASVSISAASKALSPYVDRCDLAPDTRDRILSVARELGWSRDRRSPARTRRHWHNVAILWGVRAPKLGAYEQVCATLTGVFGEGVRVLVAPVPCLEDWEELRLSLQLDGAIVLGRLDDGILADLERREFPIVLVNEESSRGLHQFLADEIAGSSALVEHLLHLGHRRVVYVRNPWEPGHYSERDRLTAIRNATRAGGAQLYEILGADLPAIISLCQGGATAVICHQYSDVAGVLEGMIVAGLAVPRDVSLAVCHDLSWFRFTGPSITALAVPVHGMAEAGARLLLELIVGERDIPLQRQVMPVPLIVRSSTGPASGNRA